MKACLLLLSVVLLLFVCIRKVQSSHFRGAIITWKPGQSQVSFFYIHNAWYVRISVWDTELQIDGIRIHLLALRKLFYVTKPFKWDVLFYVLHTDQYIYSEAKLLWKPSDVLCSAYRKACQKVFNTTGFIIYLWRDIPLT